MSKQNQKPTEAELEILGVLWQRDAATVREVHEVLNAIKPTGYTTVLKTLQIMTEKNLVERDEEARAHVYRARIEREATQRKFAEDLLKRVFGGSASQLVMRVLETKPASDEELNEIRRMIDAAESKGDKQ
jgi:predicted transcriptional regulator